MQYSAGRILVFVVPLTVGMVGRSFLSAADCNHNGVEDAVDVRGTLGFSYPPRAYVPITGFGAIAAGDFNRDGDVDIVLAGGCVDCSPPRPTGVVLEINDGSGTFSEGPTINTPGQPAAVVVTDLDGDANPDLATVTANENLREDHATVSVLLGRGDGTFRPHLDFALENDRGAASMVSGDFNGDGLQDLVVGASGPLEQRVMSVFLNEGGGRFAGSKEYPSMFFAQLLVHADLDADGDLDLAAAGADQSFVVLLANEGNGVFAPPVLHELTGVPLSLAAHDVDSDGSADLVALTGGAVSILLSRGPAGLAPAENHALPPLRLLRYPMLLDFDLDGDLDLAGGWGGSVRILLNDGGWEFQHHEYYLGRRQGSRLVAADFNGDGALDLMIGGTLLLASPDRGLAAPPVYRPWGFDAPIGPLTALDLDLDGDMDVLHQYGTGLSAAWVQAGEFAETETYRSPAGHSHVALVAAPLDEDGYLDVVTLNAEDSPRSIDVFLSDGPRSFRPPVTYSVEGTPSMIVAADFTGDGRPDVALAGSMEPQFDDSCQCYRETVWLLINQGLGILGPPVAAFDQDAASPTDSIAAADFDRDGRADLAAAGDGLIILHGKDDGTLEPWHEYGLHPGDIAAADLNQDGWPDLAGIEIGAVTEFINRGAGDFLPPVTYELSGPFGGKLLAGDIDGDGSLDLAAASSYTDGLQVLRNRGDGSFEEAVEVLPPGLELPSPMLLDLDGDRDLDLCVVGLASLSFAPGGITIFENLSAPPSSHDANRNSIPDECESSFRRGEANADSAFDISDPLVTLGFLFLEAEAPRCLDAADSNDDGRLDQSDAVYSLHYLFLDGPEPPPPFVSCSPDPTNDALECLLSTKC